MTRTETIPLPICGAIWFGCAARWLWLKRCLLVSVTGAGVLMLIGRRDGSARNLQTFWRRCGATRR